MRVAIFGETRLWGGLEVHAVALAEWLADQGHTVSLVCLGPETRRVYEKRPPRGTSLVEVAPPARRTVRGWWRALRDVHADAVVLEKGTLWTGGLALDSVLRLKFGRYVAIQQLEPPDLPAPPEPSVSRRAAARRWTLVVPMEMGRLGPIAGAALDRVRQRRGA